MQSKRNVVFVIMGLISMIVAGYALFITVFDQIISQNEGFFYAIVFGGILILVYIFINVGCKLLVISEEARKGKAIKIVSLVILTVICGLFAYSRLIYSSSFNPQEADFYNSAILINNDSLFSSTNLTTKLMNNPSEFALALVFSVLFNVFPESDNLIIISNVIMCIGIAIMIYFIVHYFADSLCSVIAAAFSLFLPMQMYSVYTYKADIFMAFLFFAYLLSASSLIFAQTRLKKVLSFAFFIITFAFLIFAEPVFVFLGVLILIGSLITNKQNSVVVAAGLIAGIVLFAGLTYYKATIFNLQINDMLSTVLNCFNNRRDTSTGSIKSVSEIKELFDLTIGAEGKHIENNFSSLSKANGISVSQVMAAWLILENQLLYMLVLVLSVSAIFTAIQKKDNRVVIAFSAVISSVIYLILSTPREMNTFFVHSIFAIFAGCGFFYIYINHHPEAEMVIGVTADLTEKPEVQEDEISAEEREKQYQKFLIRANALIFYDEDDGLYKMIRSEDRQLAIEMKQRENSGPSVDNETVVTDAVYINNDNTYTVEPNQDMTVETTPVSIADEFLKNEILDAKYVEIDNKPAVSSPAASDYSPDSFETEINQTTETLKETETVTLLHNPLPVPEKKPHVEMTFDRIEDEGDASDWDFDIQGDDFDDFDH